MAPSFSRRTAWNLEESTWAAAVRLAWAGGNTVYDLTVSNPAQCGFVYDSELFDRLAAVHVGYHPDPRGMESARRAVVGYYADHGCVATADRVVLTTSTSEAYFYLLRLLCDPGDEILAAQPSYPLFNYLADLCDVELRAYPLFYDFGWWIDFAELERQITPRTRAILLVHPNNPTGHATSPAERQRLQEICRDHGLALIVDEVFLDYSLEGKIKSFASESHPVLTFVVSGLSKVAALPQMKIAWLAAYGPEQSVSEAVGRLEMIADTFLSVNTPMQVALPEWLASRHSIQSQILERVKANLAVLHENRLERLWMDGGWTAIVRLEAVRSMKRFTEDLLDAERVIVHPGRSFGIAEPNRIVISLIGPSTDFLEGVRRLRRFVREGG